MNLLLFRYFQIQYHQTQPLPIICSNPAVYTLQYIIHPVRSFIFWKMGIKLPGITRSPGMLQATNQACISSELKQDNLWALIRLSQAIQGLIRSGKSVRTSLMILASSTIWKSNIPTQAKSAPFSKAYLKPSFGEMAPAPRTL